SMAAGQRVTRLRMVEGRCLRPLGLGVSYGTDATPELPLVGLLVAMSRRARLCEPEERASEQPGAPLLRAHGRVTHVLRCMAVAPRAGRVRIAQAVPGSAMIEGRRVEADQREVAAVVLGMTRAARLVLHARVPAAAIAQTSRERLVTGEAALGRRAALAEL